MDNCPRCGREIGKYPAMSRRDNFTDICALCGVGEAMVDFGTAHCLQVPSDEIQNEQRMAEYITGHKTNQIILCAKETNDKLQRS